MKLIYISPSLLEKIDRKAHKIADEWNYPENLRWQVWQMCATIMSGKAEKARFEGNGIVVKGWNDGYTPAPYNAWGGFYRLERWQNVGTTLHYTWLKETPEARKKQFEFARKQYRLYDLTWEPVDRVWGYHCYQEFYNQDEAETLADTLKEDSRTRRVTVEERTASGMWATRWESTRKPQSAPWRHIWRQRINDQGNAFTI